MLRRLVLLSFALVLSACSSTNVQQDFDASRDFAAYRSWAWQEPGLQYRPDDPRIKSDLTEQRIRTAVAEQLDQRGTISKERGGRGSLPLPLRAYPDPLLEPCGRHQHSMVCVKIQFVERM